MSDNDMDGPLTEAEQAYVNGVLGIWEEERITPPSAPLSLEDFYADTIATLKRLDDLRRAADASRDGS